MTGMLDDIKVLDFTTNIAGPGAAAIFTDYGARVIHVESQTGDTARTYVPFLEGKSLAHAWINRGKESLVMNLKDPRAVEVVKKLAADADVLIEGFRPGVMARLGLGYEDIRAINPKIVYCHISAFGQTGPYAGKPGFDVMGQALSGMISVNGEKGGRPIKHGVTIADYEAGPNSYAAIMTALYYQRRTGIGQEIDCSLLNGMIFLNSPIERYLNEGIVIKPNGGHHTGLCPFGGFFNDKDEGVIICAPTPKPWECLAKAMGRPDMLTEGKYSTGSIRAKNQVEIIKEIEAWLCTFPNMDAAIACMDKYGVPNCKINTTKDVCEDPQVQHMGYIVEAPTPDDIEQPTWRCRAPFAKFSVLPGEIHKAPTLGQHTESILESLGYSSEEIDSMLADWAPTGK